ncbi:MAG TPA: WYL domain-containing protein [Acidimicrobiales bacterium]|nr:WYL domain-containing protein [Acidimicrobiales bacterium]
MRRADRLYALVEELRARSPRPVARSDLAARLEVTPRTVERDVLALQVAGVPIWSQRGRGGGYAIDRRWSLPPLNFDATEALAVIAALASAPASPFAEAGRRAEQKLLASMGAPEAARARELAGRLRVGAPTTPAARRVAAAVEEAVLERRVVELGYRDRHGTVTWRTVEAQGLHLAPTGPYLMGWCRLRHAGRAFRFDRIVSVTPTDEVAPERELESLLDWFEDTVAPAAAEGGDMPTTKRAPARTGRPGPPRRGDDRTGSSRAFAAAVATALPGVDTTTRRGVTSYAAAGRRFLLLDDEEQAVVGSRPEDIRTLSLPRVGRDEVRRAVESAWAQVAGRPHLAAHRRALRARAALPPVTHDDIRRLILALPGAAEGPIWGSTVGFLVGTDKRTRFARFGPGAGNLLPPDDDDSLVILRCQQRAALLAARPDRWFVTAHYGDPTEPGAVITRVSEHRGEDDLRELAELLEDAWREVAPPELVARRDAEPGSQARP